MRWAQTTTVLTHFEIWFPHTNKGNFTDAHLSNQTNNDASDYRILFRLLYQREECSTSSGLFHFVCYGEADVNKMEISVAVVMPCSEKEQKQNVKFVCVSGEMWWHVFF